MSFWSGISQLRTILDTETDAGSPTNEESMSQIRENIEALIMLLLDTGVSGTATSDPSNDTNGYFYDTSGGWSDDEHNGRTLLITSGSAKGNTYTIDDTDDANDRLVCTGDNLYSDGVRSGDSYKILYDLKNNADGHNHDGVNSPSVVLPSGTIPAWTSEGTEYSTTSTTEDSKTKIVVYYPGTFSHLIIAARMKSSNNDSQARLRLYKAGVGSSYVYQNSTNYIWTLASSNWDISGLGWSPGLVELDVRLWNQNSSRTAYLKGLFLAWANF